jgi:hypothetical protein
MTAGARQQRFARQRREARWIGAGGFLAALALPIVLFHSVVETLAADFKMEAQYLSGWTPWVLLAGGLLFLLPVAWSSGMDPESRFFPRARTAYAGWGITLYLLGFMLAWQVMKIQGAAIGG